MLLIVLTIIILTINVKFKNLKIILENKIPVPWICSDRPSLEASGSLPSRRVVDPALVLEIDPV